MLRLKRIQKHLKGLVYDEVELIVSEKLDNISDKLADEITVTVNENLSDIEKLVIDSKSKDEILTAINNAKIKTNKN